MTATEIIAREGATEPLTANMIREARDTLRGNDDRRAHRHAELQSFVYPSLRVTGEGLEAIPHSSSHTIESSEFDMVTDLIRRQLDKVRDDNKTPMGICLGPYAHMLYRSFGNRLTSRYTPEPNLLFGLPVTPMAKGMIAIIISADDCMSREPEKDSKILRRMYERARSQVQGQRPETNVEQPTESVALREGSESTEGNTRPSGMLRGTHVPTGSEGEWHTEYPANRTGGSSSIQDTAVS